MELTRTIYRYSFFVDVGPVRDSKAFKTERAARVSAARLKAMGYVVVVWRERQVKAGHRWKTDLDDELTEPLDS